MLPTPSSKQGTLVAGEWQPEAGTGKLFMRQEQFHSLEAAQTRRWATTCAPSRPLRTASWHGGVKALFAALAAAVKALLGADNLPFQGCHLPQVQDAK